MQKIKNPMVVPLLFFLHGRVLSLTDYSAKSRWEREKIVSVSVSGCFTAVMNSRKAEGAVISTSQDARLAV